MLQCLTNIVGVTDTTNDCILAGLDGTHQDALKLSVSGLYLDDLEGGVHMKAVKFADATKPFYDMAMDSIKNASKRLEDDLILELAKQYQKNRNNFIGQIGRMSFAQTLGTLNDWQGLRLRPVDYSNAVLTLTRFNLVVSLSATFNVYLVKVLYGAAMGTIINTFPITTVGGSYTAVDVNAPDGIRLPLTENGQAVEYWLVYSKTESGGALPKDTKVECSTCPSNQPKVGDFINAQGVDVADLSNLQNANADSFTHGFILDVSIKCDAQELFCSQYDADEAIAVCMSYAVWYKAGELLIEDVLKSPDVNRYTTMDRTYLWGKRNHFRAAYQERIIYLGASIDVSSSNCYVCKEQKGKPFMSGILS